ncbi:MAG: FIVAR domain-containing protein, partial [Oscillospiraceae bacterium]|nr:FIVAR domain-containing protein [Oscillospiraceae bacterium]
MKTRFLAFLLALVMALSMTLSVAAAETAPALVLEIGNGKGTVTVDIYLQDGAGITNGKFTATYDASVLTLVETQAGYACAMSSINTETPGTVSMTWVGSDLTAEKTLLLSLKLEVPEGTAQALSYAVVSNGIFTDTTAVEVAGDSVTVNFEAPVNTAALEAAINAAEDVDASLYTAESYATLKDALAAGMAVLANTEATQEEVNNAAKAIPAALAGLVVWSADTSKLEEAIAAAKALDKALYTEDSFQAVAAALEKAEAVLAKENATQDEVDAATKSLKAAIAALKKVDGSADTGDNSHIGLWIAVLLVSLAALVATMVGLIRSGKGEQVCRCLAILLVASMLLTMAPVTSIAIVNGDGAESEKESILENLKDIFDGKNKVVQGEDTTFAGTVKQVFDLLFNLKVDQNMNATANLYKPEQIVRILVELDGKCLLDQGYTQKQINANGAQVAADTAKLETMQDFVAKQIAKLAEESGLGKTSVKYNYTAALNGMAMSVPYGIVAQIAKLDGVKGAYVCSQYNAPEAKESEDVFVPSMYATGEWFGSVQTWETLGYTGKGMTVAVLDTGLDIDHPSFVGVPEGAKLTLADIEAVLTELNAYHLFTETSAVPLEAEDLYYNGKVPFGFNYVDCGLDITHDYDAQGDHGSHVAG